MGVLQPGGDLISEISLRLTKLSVKQSLVGNRAGGFSGGEREGTRGEHLGAERTWRHGCAISLGRDTWLSITRPPLTTRCCHVCTHPTLSWLLLCLQPLPNTRAFTEFDSKD